MNAESSVPSYEGIDSASTGVARCNVISVDAAAITYAVDECIHCVICNACITPSDSGLCDAHKYDEQLEEQSE